MLSVWITLLAGCARPARLPGDASVVVVSIDTLRADHVGAYGSTSGATPSLDRLAARGALFVSAFTPVPLTLPAHTSLFSGRWPFRHGVRMNGTDRVGPDLPLLASAFREAGFATGAFVGALVLRSEVGLSRGFDIYDETFAANEERPQADWTAERRGDEVVDRALAWLDGQGERRVFLWVHLYDPHAPYDPPAGIREKFPNPYDGDVAAADAALGRLVARLDARRGKTLIAVVGDHGESLGEHGEATHGVFLYDATLRVPFVVAAAGGGRRIAEPVSLVDLAPTLREAAGLPRDDGADGISLWGAVARGEAVPARTLYAESVYPAALLGWSPLRAARTASEKYVEAPRREYFDIAVDPGETTNRFDALAERPRALARALAALLGSAGPAPARSPSREADPETVRRLASLGYLTPPAGGHELDRIDATRVDPKDRIGSWERIEKAILARQLGKSGEAVAFLSGLDPAVLHGDPAIAREWALVLRRSRQMTPAAEAYERILSRFPPVAGDWFGLGICRHLQGLEKDAVAAHEEAVRLDPSLLDAWINLGQGALLIGDTAKAEHAFSRAVTLDDRNADGLNGLAAVAVERRDFATAEARLNEALARDPDRRDTRENLARVRRERHEAERRPDSRYSRERRKDGGPS